MGPCLVLTTKAERHMRYAVGKMNLQLICISRREQQTTMDVMFTTITSHMRLAHYDVRYYSDWVIERATQKSMI